MQRRLVQGLRFNQKTAKWPLLLTFLLLLPGPAAADQGPSPRQRFSQFLAGLRQQAPQLLPGLPFAGAIRDPAGWAQNQFDAMQDALGLTEAMRSAPARNGADGPSLLQPVAALIAPPPAEQAEAAWLSPAYHHKGMLPFHDTVMLGFGVRETLADRKLSFELQPSYGQNWVSARSYWGASLAMTINPDNSPKPWGRIALGFTQGDAALLDHGHGLTLHSEWNIADSLAIHAGIRSSEAMRADDFVLLRWNVLDALKPAGK